MASDSIRRIKMGLWKRAPGLGGARGCSQGGQGCWGSCRAAGGAQTGRWGLQRVRGTLVPMEHEGLKGSAPASSLNSCYGGPLPYRSSSSTAAQQRAVLSEPCSTPITPSCSEPSTCLPVPRTMYGHRAQLLAHGAGTGPTPVLAPAPCPPHTAWWPLSAWHLWVPP